MKNNKFLTTSVLVEVALLVIVVYPIGYFLITTKPSKLQKVIIDITVWKAIWITISTSSLSTLLGLILGVPTAYAMSHKNNFIASIMEKVMVIPTLIPHVIVGIIILVALGGGKIGSILSKLGLSPVDSFWGIVFVLFFVSFPYILSSASAGFHSFPEALEESAYTLGVSPLKTFLKLSLPLAFPSILRGTILSFARAMSETGALLIVATYPRTAQILILNKFETEGLSNAQAISFIVIILSFIIFALLLSIKQANWNR